MTPETVATLPFLIDAFGRFRASEVDVTLVPTPRPSTPALDALIAEEWERRTARARVSDPILFNGALLRYVDHAVTPEAPGRPARFGLTVGPTCYRDFVGTNLYNHHRLAEFGWHRFANPIGTTATLLTADGLICYGRRSDRVAYHARHVHTFGGGLEASDVGPDGRVDPFLSLSRELSEELDLRAEDLGELVCVGLIRDREIHQPELLLEATVRLTAEQIRDRWRRAEAREEHDEIVALADRPDAVVPFIRGCAPIAPVAVGALMLHGRRRWGEGWFARSAEELRSDRPTGSSTG